MPGERKRPSLEGLALLYLRSMRRWSQKELATCLGWADPKQISRYETGDNPLRREQLDVCVAAMGYPPEAVDALLFFGGLIRAEPPEEPSSPVALTGEERRAVDRAVLAAARSVVDELREELVREKRKQKAEAVRREARELWDRMKAGTRQERRELVTVFPEFRSWALAERICHESEQAAAHKVEMALELSNLALFIAERSSGAGSWRSRLEGYCWAYIANARRVANDFAGADRAFARAWELWKVGATAGPGILAEWRLLDLEASLRREQHRFPAALELLDKAMALKGNDPATSARILLKKEHVLEQMGDIQGALAALTEVAPILETLGDDRLLFAHHFKTVNNLCHLRRYREAEERLPQVRELAVQQSNELDFIRLLWLEARLAAGLGRRKDAAAGLERIRQEFTARGLAYDAALASLELAVLYLQEGRTTEVRDLTRSMSWIFQSQGIAREALAVLTLFRDAAQCETATVELVMKVMTRLEDAKCPAPLAFHRQRGRV
ncbi:MAG TPA: helix-turn-helix transcriptional regulator [Thermoanaerobaculia bacterium]|jgi:transcriptional regulator with XRE-family HTH domain|nr:helix-turn-helix transcriptional regulator [Thermoanaerobaculia bacterium]